LLRVWSKLFQKQNIASDDGSTVDASNGHYIAFYTVEINNFSFHLQITTLVRFSRIVHLALLNWIIFIFMIKFILISTIFLFTYNFLKFIFTEPQQLTESILFTDSENKKRYSFYIYNSI
jgi:hypothetical protein